MLIRYFQWIKNPYKICLYYIFLLANSHTVKDVELNGYSTQRLLYKKFDGKLYSITRKRHFYRLITELLTKDSLFLWHRLPSSIELIMMKRKSTFKCSFYRKFLRSLILYFSFYLSFSFYVLI